MRWQRCLSTPSTDQIPHRLHAIHILCLLHRKLFRWIFDVFFGVDTDKISAHRERNGDWVIGDFVAGDIDDVLSYMSKTLV